MVVAGDINSYIQPQIDHLAGLVNIRPCCLAATLSTLSFRDSFRTRHPDKVAFTHISKSGGSRFDQLWIRPATGATLQVVKATIIWKWPYPTDHTPVLADISSGIPLIEGKRVSNLRPKLRTVLQKANDPKTRDDVVQAVQERIDPKKKSINK